MPWYEPASLSPPPKSNYFTPARVLCNEEAELTGEQDEIDGIQDKRNDCHHFPSQSSVLLNDALSRRMISFLSPINPYSGEIHFASLHDTLSHHIPMDAPSYSHPSCLYRKELKRVMMPTAEEVSQSSTGDLYSRLGCKGDRTDGSIIFSSDAGENEDEAKNLVRSRRHLLYGENEREFGHKNQRSSVSREMTKLDYQESLVRNPMPSSLVDNKQQLEHSLNSSQHHISMTEVNESPHSRFGYIYNERETAGHDANKRHKRQRTIINNDDKRSSHEQDWAQIGAYVPMVEESKFELGGRLKEKYAEKNLPSKRKKKKKRPKPDIRAMMSTPERKSNANHTTQQVQKRCTSKTIEEEIGPEKENKKQEESKIATSQDDIVDSDGNCLHTISYDTLKEISEHHGVKNAGSSNEALSAFLRMVQAHKYVTWTLIFHDHECTTPFLPSTRKYCTEKGPVCKKWNCSCDNQIRAMQASQPLVGAMFILPTRDTVPSTSNYEAEAMDCFLLPLGPTCDPENGPNDIDPGYERMGHWPFLKITCDCTIKDRWDIFRSILMDKHVVCATFNAPLALMPYHYHCAHDNECSNVENSHCFLDLVIPGIWDLRLASWMLSPHSDESELEFDKKREGFPHLWPKSQTCVEKYSSKQLQGLIRAKEQLEFLSILYPVINNLLHQNDLKGAFEEIESPIQSVLSAMECFGVGFKEDRLVQIKASIESRIKLLLAESRHIAHDESFLLSSPHQVSQLLFDQMGIEVPEDAKRRNKKNTSHRSTSEETLRAIQKRNISTSGKGLRIIDILLEHRALSKVLNGYVRPLPKLARKGPTHLVRIQNNSRQRRQKKSKKAINRMRIHPMWCQTAVRTGRLSCRKPNMQQIPTGNVSGMCLRNAFTSSSKSTCLFACDYSQNEVRILAHMSGDAALISLFTRQGSGDIYEQMSSLTTGKAVENISDQERSVAKQVTLAIMYGMGLPQVAKKLNVSRQVAQRFIQSFYGRFEGVRRWMEETKEFVRSHKYVKTIVGRRR
jgi:DNA polymerase-1